MTNGPGPTRSSTNRAIPAALLLVAFTAGAVTASPLAAGSIEGRLGEARTARAVAAAVAVAIDLLTTERACSVPAATIVVTVSAADRAAPSQAPDSRAIPATPLAERLLDLPPPMRA
ncbi:MAG: hypothetical protein ACYTGR_00985 [Planctomycetota bacterium]